MSRRKKLPSNLASTPEPSSSGKRKAESRQSKRLQDSEDTMSSHTQLVLNLFGLQSSTPELVPAHNNQTLIDKSPLLLPSTPTQKSSAKLEGDSTSSEKSFKPYWNESCSELSNALLWRTKIGSPDLGLTTSDGSVSYTGVKSWYLTKQHLVPNERWLKTSSPSSIA